VTPKQTNKSVSLRDLEHENQKFLAPATEKERSILEAALSLMAERGIDGATTAEIAKRADVTEKTLFRYFPSKSDLTRRVLFPLLLRAGLPRGWEAFEKLLGADGQDFHGWYKTMAENRLSNISRNPGLSRTVLLEVLQNEEFRASLSKLWQQHIWQPMVDGLRKLQTEGAIRPDVDVEVLARAIHCLHIGYFLVRYVFAPDRKWDDAGEIEKMAQILAHGSASKPRRA
jgi:TetR/AcrR family transcriptional regulator